MERNRRTAMPVQRRGRNRPGSSGRRENVRARGGTLPDGAL